MPERQQIRQSKKPDTIFQKQATPIKQIPISNPKAIIQHAKVNPKSLTHADVMQLQRTIGNRAVGKLLSEIGLIPSTAKPVQRQEIPEEQETCPSCVQRQEIPEEEEPLQGKMIETVQRQEIQEEEEPLQGKMIETVQRQEIPEEEEPLQGKMIETIQRQEIPEEEEPLQGKMIETVQRQEIPEEEEPLQGKMIGTIQLQEIPEEETLQTKKENNTGMPDNLKAGVENLSGIDMSDVRVHYNSDKPAEVGALAYTQGTDIHVAPGQERHLPHEAWHVVQQAQGRVKPTMQLKDGVPVNNDKGLEQEADVISAKAVPGNDQLVAQKAKSDPISRKKGYLNILSSQRAPVQYMIQLDGELPISGDTGAGTPGYYFMSRVNNEIERMGFIRSTASQIQVRNWITTGNNHFADMNALVNALIQAGHLARPVRGAALGPRGLGARPLFTHETDVAFGDIPEGMNRRHVISSSTLGRAIETAHGDLIAVHNFLTRHDQTAPQLTGNEALDMARAKRTVWKYVHNHIGNLWLGRGPINTAIGFIRTPLTQTLKALQAHDVGDGYIALNDPLFSPPLPQGVRAVGPGADHWNYVTGIITQTLQAVSFEEQSSGVGRVGYIRIQEAIEIYNDVVQNCDLDLPDGVPVHPDQYTKELLEIYAALRAPGAIFEVNGTLDRFIALNLQQAPV